MSTLLEIEKAAASLPLKDKTELLRFLLRIVPANQQEISEPRVFTEEEVQGWLDEDQASMHRLREKK